MTSSPRRGGGGLHNPDASFDQIQCFWLAEVRNFTNIMIELMITAWSDDDPTMILTSLYKHHTFPVMYIVSPPFPVMYIVSPPASVSE